MRKRGKDTSFPPSTPRIVAVAGKGVVAIYDLLEIGVKLARSARIARLSRGR
jgi:hypothetical protein